MLNVNMENVKALKYVAFFFVFFAKWCFEKNSARNYVSKNTNNNHLLIIAEFHPCKIIKPQNYLVK